MTVRLFMFEKIGSQAISSIKRYRKNVTSSICFTALFLPFFELNANEGLIENAVENTSENNPKERVIPTLTIVSDKRDRPAQDTAIASVVLNDDSINELHINNLHDLSSQTVNFNVTRSPGGMFNLFIRGVGLDDFNLSSISAVGVYSDDISVSNTMASRFPMFDLERIEIHRGPQSTLFGNNTTGGAVNLVSRKPAMRESQLNRYIKLSLSRFNNKVLEFGSDHLINQQSSLRASTYFQQQDGHTQSTVDQNDTKFNSINQKGFRFQWQHEPDEKKTLLAQLRYYKQSQITPVRYLLSADDQLVAENPDNIPLFRNNSQAVNPPDDLSMFGASLRINWTFPSFLWASITSFHSVESVRMDDWGPQGEASSVPDIFTYNSTNTRQWSQEFQWISIPSSSLSWLFGAFYLADRGDLLQAAFIDPVGRGRPDDAINDANMGPLFDRAGWVQTNTDTSSLYGQLNFEHSKQWLSSLGYRWTRQQLNPSVHSAGMMMDLPGQEFPLGSLGWYSLGNDSFNVYEDVADFNVIRQFVNANGGFPASSHLNNRFTEWGGKFSVQYRSSKEWMTFFNLSKGYKMGTVNSNPSTLSFESLLSKVVKPESMITYELGIKSDLFDRTLRVNSTIFLNDWKNYQFYLASNPGAPQHLFASLINVPKAESKGIEIEMQMKLDDLWSVNASVAFLDSKITDGELDLEGIPLANQANYQSQVITGNRLTHAPKKSASFNIAKEWEISNGWLSLLLGMQYQSDQTHQLKGENTDRWFRNFSEASVTTWLLKSSYTFGMNASKEISFWVKNATDERFCTERSAIPGTNTQGVRLCSMTEPRQWGLQFIWHVD